MKTINKHTTLNSTYLIYLCFLIMLFMVFLAESPQFERVDAGAIKQILHPEHPKGEISYGPHYHYNYIVAFASKWFGYKENFTDLAGIFWFLETFFAILVLIKLCNLIFKNNKMILVIAIMLYMLTLLYHGCVIDQKTMARPLYLLAIYFFLREKWIISAIFGASLFYLHVGLALWWFLPSCFALAVIFLTQKRVHLKQIVNYVFVVIILASPVLFFYLTRAPNSAMNEFSVRYFYYVVGEGSSVLSALSNVTSKSINTLLITVIFLVGYNKAKKVGFKNDNIIPVAIGVLILYIINFIFADILGNGTVIILQLLRSIIHIELFSSLFFAFLLTKQIKKGNYVFLLLFALLIGYFGHLCNYFEGKTLPIILNAFYFTFLMYEIFEKSIFGFLGEIRKILEIKFSTDYLKNIVGKCNRLLQQPVFIAIFFIFLITPKIQGLKQYIKSTLNIPLLISVSPSNYLMNDIARFTNEKIKDKNALLLIPFTSTDFEYFTNHKIFINYCTPIYFTDIQHKDKVLIFKDILENDLNYSLEKLFENNSNKELAKKWEEFWKSLDEETIRHWKRKYNITHVIREREFPLDFPIIYQNQFYAVYEIR